MQFNKSKSKFCFIKYGGLASGGTERALQKIAAQMAIWGFKIDYFFCEPKVSPGSTWIHPPNELRWRKFLESSGVNLFEFKLSYKDLSQPVHTWVDTDFFEIFQKNEYEMAWTAKAGHKEFPFYLLGIPFVELVTLDTGFDNSDNNSHTYSNSFGILCI